MLKTIFAAAFKSKGKNLMSTSELTYVLSFDLKWFSHDKSRQIIELAKKKGILVEEGNFLKPNFDVNKVEVPVDFKPDIRKVFISSFFEKIAYEISEKTGKEFEEVVAMINKKQEKLGNLLDIDVVALIVAKENNIEVQEYVDEVWKTVFKD